MDLQAVIFDLDNTLIDFMKMKKKSCEAAIEAMRENGLEMDKEDALEVLYDLYNEHGWEHQRIFQLFLEKVTGEIDYKVMASGIVAYRRIKQGYLYPYSEVPEVLEELKDKNYKLAILTDAPRIQAWTRLCAMELQDKFDLVLASEDMKRNEKESKPFLQVLEEFGIQENPEKVLMVGDSLDRDIIPAKKAGLKTAFARYGVVEEYNEFDPEKYEKREEEGIIDHELDSFSQILEIV